MGLFPRPAVRLVRLARIRSLRLGRPMGRVRVRWPWQRLVVVPLLALFEGLRGVFVWLFDLLEPRPPRILDPRPAGEFLVVGHRGAPVERVENTIESFEQAVRNGANAIEVDLCVTRDAQVVAWHDWDPDERVARARQAGGELEVLARPVAPEPGDPMRRPVSELTLGELLAHYGYARVGSKRSLEVRVPLLDDVVHWAARRPGVRAVILDVKVPGPRAELMRAVLGALGEAVGWHRPACTFVLLVASVEALEVAREQAPDLPRMLDIEIPAGWVRNPERLSAIGPARALGNRWAAIGRPRFTLGGWRIYRGIIRRDLEGIREGLAKGTAPVDHYVCWTINRPREMRRLLRMGVHGILTDDVPALARLIRSPGSDGSSVTS